MNIFRTKRYNADGPAENVKSDEPESSSIFGKAMPSSKTRKALGDITNSVSSDQQVGGGKDGIKKQQTMFAMPPAPVPTIQAEVSVSEMALFDGRIYMQRDADDIDSRDADNPLLCADYVNRMYDVFGDQEKEVKVNPAFMSSQPFINERMRTILVDWLVEVHLKFKMVPETLYLTVNIIDRFLELKQVRRSKLQLVGVSSLLLAAKYEEIYPPELRDLVYITDRAYNKQEILEMETQIFNALSFNLTVPTIHSFLCRYLKAAHADRTMVQLACYLAERALQEYSMVKYLPSTIAACAVYAARQTLRRHPWSPTLLKYTKLDENDLKACIDDMKLFVNNESSPQQAVNRKYSSPKFGAVAKMQILF